MIPYLLFPLLIFFSASLGVIISPLWGSAPFVLILVIIPIIDSLLPKMQNPEKNLKNGVTFDLTLILVFPFIVMLFFSGMWVASETNSMLGAGFLGASIGMATGSVGLPAAHELIHRTGKIFQSIGLLTLLFCFYGQFRIEHIHGHHSKVATVSDPATARPGENVYIFLIRCVTKSWWSAWKIEKRLIERKEQPLFSYKNRMIFYFFQQLILLISTWFFCDVKGLIFLTTHTVVAILLLEIVEYIQHYGLQRLKTDQAEIEPYNKKHAWDCRHYATNWSTFNLGLHSDHHSKPGKRFPLLSNQAPQNEMPFSYPIMILLALVPPIWFKIMNHRIKNKIISSY